MKPPPDPMQTMFNEVNGACKLQIIAAINGNIPKQWHVSTLEMLPTFLDPPYVVCVGIEQSATSGNWKMLGARLELSAPMGHLELADELARRLSQKIRNARPARVRIALDPGAFMPTRGTAGSSGYDLYAPIDYLIRSGQTVVIHSGVHVELPDDSWEGEIRGRSSMSKRSLLVHLGTIDSDYRGVVGATVTNLSSNDESIKRGERYAQMVLSRVEHPEIDQVEVAELTSTERGDRGFGSTGR